MATATRGSRNRKASKATTKNKATKTKKVAAAGYKKRKKT